MRLTKIERKGISTTKLTYRHYESKRGLNLLWGKPSRSGEDIERKTGGYLSHEKEGRKGRTVKSRLQDERVICQSIYFLSHEEVIAQGLDLVGRGEGRKAGGF